MQRKCPRVKGMHNLRTAGSGFARGLRDLHRGSYLNLHVLNAERARLEQEREQWIERQRVIDKRLSEIREQTEFLERQLREEIRARRTERYKEISIEY